MSKKITIRNSVKIIDNKYVIKKKKNDINNIYNYLLSRSFDYFPSVIKEEEDKIYYNYIDDVDEPSEQKILDLLNLLSLLHNKTTIYKEVDLDYYKYIYESVIKKIDDVMNYYDSLMEYIDSEVYMSPTNYLIARNISIIYGAIFYSKNSIDRWYKLVEDGRKIRLTTIHNSPKLDHYVKNEKSYLLSWDNSRVDMPIYDIIFLYKSHYLEFDFVSLLDDYFNKYPFSSSEMILFLCLLSIPDKIEYSGSQYKTVISVRRIIDYIYKTNDIVSKYDIKLEKESIK